MLQVDIRLLINFKMQLDMKKILYCMFIGALLSGESNAQTNNSWMELLSADKNHIATRTYTQEPHAFRAFHAAALGCQTGC